MSETEALPVAQQNGKVLEAPPEPTPLPEGTITLPPEIVAVFSRLVQQDQHVQDLLFAYLRGLGRNEPLSLVLPVVLLMRPREMQGGPSA
jgi:hypothetical protein